MSNRELVESMVRSVADRYGFRTVRNRNFYLTRRETSGIVNIQKSNYGSSYYLNAGLWLNSLAGEAPTAHHKYHIRWRVDAADKDLQDLDHALDLNVEMSDADRREIVSRSAEKNGFGLISALADEDAALRFAVTNPEALVLREVCEMAHHKLGYELP